MSADFHVLALSPSAQPLNGEHRVRTLELAG
jgi:hypothetical protein